MTILLACCCPCFCVLCLLVNTPLQVIASESCLRSSAVDRSDLASLLRQVQELERNKLKLTLSW